MTKLLRLLTLLVLCSQIVSAQSNLGGIYGKVLDEKKQGLDFASVTASEGGVLKGGAKTDLNGNYKIKGLAPGRYEIKVTFVGYKESITRDVIVQSDKFTSLDIEMEKRESASATKKEVVIKDYKRKLIDPDGSNTNYIAKEAIRNNSSARVGDLVGLTTGVVQTKAGSQNLNINGGRSENTLYMIDGMMIRPGRSVNLPQNAINDIELFTNGLSAKYGNATGGIVAINTRGITPKLNGSLLAQHSIDGFNTNSVSLDIAGPLLKRKTKSGFRQPVMGFSLNLGLTYDKDGDPAFDGYLRVKPEVRERLEANPLVPNPNGISGNYVNAADLLRASDFERIKAREDGQNFGLTYQGKLDFQPVENINITLGTYALYSKARTWRFTNTLLAPSSNPLQEDLNLRGFVRLTQKLGKPASSEKSDAKKSPITDAFYSLQFTYQRDLINGSNPQHKRNTFNYGYIGRFQQYRSDFFIPGQSLAGNRAIVYVGQSLDSVKFTPGGVNPILENYTKAIFNSGQVINNVDQVRALFGLRNGDAPFATYDMWTGVGTQIVNYYYTDADQIQLNLDASLDIEQGGKNKKRKDPITHNIQFGLGYDQRSSSSYSLTGASLWSIMRQNTNQHFKNLDLNNPKYYVNGGVYSQADVDAGLVQVSPFDTIRYDQLYVEGDQTRIDKSLRTKLYGDPTNRTIIDIDNLDPSTFDINMFSADDLLNNGNDVVTYFGYDYLGNKLKRQPSFNDFWTKRDARGDYERPIGAFRPIYMFGYILDKFSYKDLKFNVGLRIDRYDANQKSLKDPYSLYGVRTAGDIAAGSYRVVEGTDGQGNAPLVSAFDNDYVVYIDNNQSAQPKVVGYRKGDVWYNPFGQEIADPTVLSGLYNNGLPIEPWLVTRIDSTNGIKGRNYDPNNSFEDYKPEVVLSPRIQFSFPISDKALFYGNYDVVTQTPAGSNFVTPDDYYFLYERQATIGNAALRMERAIKYSLGYQQRLSNTAAMIIESFYQERRNQIQLQQFLLAYPQGYQSFGNRDFSSTKGMTLKLDFRRNGPLRMNVAYTLQFAEGTGSSSTSQRSLLSTGQPNLRSVLPLDFDSRHIFNVSLDYRYDNDKNRGPEIFGKHPFENAGANIVFRSNSGRPYTRSSLATPITGGDFNGQPIVGSLNGSRMPWIYDFGLRVDKSFKVFEYGQRTDKESGVVVEKSRPAFLNVFVNIQNLFNIRNTTGVYRYTGIADDDGYLTSPQGIQFLSGQQFRDSFTDLYNARMINPDRFNNPRRIALGILFEF